MLFKSTIIAAVAVLFASSAMGAAIAEPQAAGMLTKRVATDRGAACNCPNNCDHGPGSTCAFFDGPSSKSKVITGHCSGTPLACVPGSK
ncbi:MAG: hypothetical protein M1812_001206 [Candelaria pacifica]|nr:MAG: hypothetical protein M1812_001206 [Candelaria pacifica]